MDALKIMILILLAGAIISTLYVVKDWEDASQPPQPVPGKAKYCSSWSRKVVSFAEVLFKLNPGSGTRFCRSSLD